MNLIQLRAKDAEAHAAEARRNRDRPLVLRSRDGPPTPYSQAGPPAGIGPPRSRAWTRGSGRDGPASEGQRIQTIQEQTIENTTMFTRRKTMKTKINNILRGGGLLAALFLMGTSSVHAATTEAGTDITNAATVTFRTAAGGTTDQSGTGDTEVFETDRLVNLTVTGGADVDVVPGQVGPSTLLVRSFNVTNTTNGIIDILLSTTDDGTDDFDESVAIRYEAGASQAYAGTETAGTTLDDVAAGATFTVHVYSTSTISTGQLNGDTDGIYLIAQAADPTTSVAITADSGSDTSTTVDNVVNDGDGDAGAVDAARNGAQTDLVLYTIRTATVSLVKTSTALYDPINCSVMDGAQNLTVTCANDAFRIPGGRVYYKLAVINADTAQNVATTQINITDSLDAASTTYVTGSLYRIVTTEAGYAGTTCYSGGAAQTDAADGDAASYAADVITIVESGGLAEGAAIVYCYKVSID
jgi:hypothetical protein